MRILLPILLTAVVLFFCALFNYYIYHKIIIYGYNERRHKRVKKLNKQSSKLDRLFLVSVSQNVEQHEFITFLMFIANFITVVIVPLFSIVMMFVAMYVGIDSSMFWLHIEWPAYWFGFYIVITFIPDLIFDPYERKRYGLSNSRRRK